MNVSGLKELTETTIEKLQNYFRIALRSNVNTVEAMTRAILATLIHLRGHSTFKIVIFLIFLKNFKIYAVLCKIYRRIHFWYLFLMKIIITEEIHVLLTHGETCFLVFQQ